MKRALGRWPGMLFGGQWLNVVCGVTIGLLLLQAQTHAQDNWPDSHSRSGNVLTFRADGNVAVSEFQIPLKKRVSEQDTTTLNAADLGPISLRSTDGKALRIERYRWKIEPSSRFYQGKSGYKSLIAIYQYGDTSQYSLRLNCRTRNTLVNCGMDGNGPLFNDEVVAKGNLNLTSGSLFSEDRPESAPSDEPAATITRLPRVSGINLRDVRVIPSEKQANSELERAILTAFPEGTSGETRYFYNRIDLNGDDSPETIVYLLGRGVCGTGGCTTLVFQSERESRYRLASKLTLMNQPIIVSDNRSNRWKDLVTYVSGGGTSPGYRLLRYDGRSYPSNPSTQPGLTNPTYLSGTAVIGDRIQPETTAPILGRGSSPNWDQPSSKPSNDPPTSPENDRPIASNGQSSAYRRGYELGQLDAKQNILRNAIRHRTEYDAASESDFRRGYDNGYSNYASGNSSNGTTDSWNRNGEGSSSRNGDSRGDWGNTGNSRDDNDTSTDARDRPSSNENQYQGQGTLIVSPTSNQGKEERYVLNRIRIESGSQDRLVLYTNNQSETIELLGRLESGFNGRSLTLSSIDGVAAQGKVLIGRNGSLRTSNPIVVNSEESEISVDFRPN